MAEHNLELASGHELTPLQIAGFSFFKCIFLFIILFIYLFMAVLGLHYCVAFSLVAVYGLLITVASLVVEHGL